MLLLLIGTSSAGKSTLARRLQDVLPDYWHYLSLDSFFAGVPDRYGGGVNGPLSAVGFAYANKAENASITYGELGRRVLTGMVAAAVAMESAGVNVLFDDMLLDAAHADLWKEALPGVESLVVRLVAPVTVLRERNARRKNPPGLAENHIASNEQIAADSELDSGLLSVEEMAERVAGMLAARAVVRTP